MLPPWNGQDASNKQVESNNMNQKGHFLNSNALTFFSPGTLFEIST